MIYKTFCPEKIWSTFGWHTSLWFPKPSAPYSPYPHENIWPSALRASMWATPHAICVIWLVNLGKCTATGLLTTTWRPSSLVSSSSAESESESSIPLKLFWEENLWWPDFSRPNPTKFLSSFPTRNNFVSSCWKSSAKSSNWLSAMKVYPWNRLSVRLFGSTFSAIDNLFRPFRKSFFWITLKRVWLLLRAFSSTLGAFRR